MLELKNSKGIKYSDDEIKKLIDSAEGSTSSIENLDKLDDLFEEAARLVVINQSGSTSLIQRKLKVGYNRAGSIINQLEATGIVGPFEGSAARQVLISDELTLEELLKTLK